MVCGAYWPLIHCEMGRRLMTSLGSGLAILVGVALCLAGEMPDKEWGPFRGRIADVETGEPIAGAAVLVVWYEMVPTPVQTNEKFYDAREAVSDADGRFEVPRRSPPFFDF